MLPDGDEQSYGKLLTSSCWRWWMAGSAPSRNWAPLLHQGGFELVSITGTPATSVLAAAPA